MRPRFRPAVLLTVLVLVAAACGNDDEATTTTVIDTIAPAASAAPDGTDPDLETEPTDPAIELVDTGLELDGPIAMAALPGSDLLLVAEREGVVRAVAPSGTGTDLEVVGDPVIDVRELVGSTDGERGLLGLATDASGDLVYLSYTEASEGASRVDEYRLERPAEGALRAVPSSARAAGGPPAVLEPQRRTRGARAGRDAAARPRGRRLRRRSRGPPQDPDTLLGKMVRIDPAVDNSGGGNTGAEIHAIGVRNPWRFSFDRETDDLWVADVGQNRFEEITVLRAPADRSADTGGSGTLAGEGANLGWDLFEGDEAFDAADPDQRTSDGPFVDPVFTYDRDAGCSITGGVVYRGAEIPALDGWYLFGDFCDPAIRALRPAVDAASTDTDTGAGAGSEPELSAVDLGVELGGTVSFAEDQQGEVYVLSLDGSVARLTAAG